MQEVFLLYTPVRLCACFRPSLFLVDCLYACFRSSPSLATCLHDFVHRWFGAFSGLSLYGDAWLRHEGIWLCKQVGVDVCAVCAWSLSSRRRSSIVRAVYLPTVSVCGIRALNLWTIILLYRLRASSHHAPTPLLDEKVGNA